jgi:hypothetical protein
MQQLIVGGDKMLNEALRQALKLKAVKAAAESPVSKATSGKDWSSQRPVIAGTTHCRSKQPVCCHCQEVGHRKGECQQECPQHCL